MFYQIYKFFFVVLTNFFHTDKIFSVFLLDMRFDFDLNRHLSVIIAAFKNRCLCLEINDKCLSLSVTLLFIFALHVFNQSKQKVGSNNQ